MPAAICSGSWAIALIGLALVRGTDAVRDGQEWPEDEHWLRETARSGLGLSDVIWLFVWTFFAVVFGRLVQALLDCLGHLVENGA